ncbi:Cytochrome c552 precursor [hydrothermal vent metagenome]|uniref:nitrite reductase (cytochrome; ammonia-forming) n=1 Tax=hydrothermal vent metagenome TaxID=652676 RepID=A0A3B1CLU1_9ZZZZ
MQKYRLTILVLMLMSLNFLLTGCAKEAQTVESAITIPEDEVDPKVWGQKFPNHYDSYLKNSERTKGYSKYRSDSEDRLSPWPFQFILADGWGMGVEYNEPNGHTDMLKDQLKVDARRKGSGGVCLTCKTPYAPKLKEEMGEDYFKKPYNEVHARIPKKDQELGLACIDCHDPATMNLRISRWTLKEGLKAIGKDSDKLTRQEMRTLVCAQCHVTYSISKNREGKSTGVKFPWANGKWGNISIEGIIKQIQDENLREWKHRITGQKLGHVRHPEFELFTAPGSVHWAANVACADCHMPYERVGSQKISSHRWESPFKKNMKPCMQCHNQTEDWLKKQVINIQDRVNHNFTKAGYAVAEAALTIEAALKTPGVDKDLISKAQHTYEQAYLRVTFIGAENSMGFHNPPEAMRILTDALAQGKEVTMMARDAMYKAGVTPPDFGPEKIDMIVRERFTTEDGKTGFRPDVPRKAATLD